MRGKRLVIAGVDAGDGVAYAVAERALSAGAFVTLVAPHEHFARWRELADRLPYGAHVVRADLSLPDDVAALQAHLRCAYGTVDGAIHTAPDDPAGFSGLAEAVAPLLPAGAAAGSLVAVTRAPDADRPLFDAGERVAGDLGDTGARVSLMAAGGDQAAAAEAACLLLGGPPIDGEPAPRRAPLGRWRAPSSSERLTT